MSAVLELDRGTVHYAGLRVLDAVSVAAPDGAVTALLGANGAGKTTTLRAISGLVALSSGSIWLDGRRIDGLAPYRLARSGILHVPEGRGVFPSLTVRANLEMCSYAAGDSVDPVAAGVALFPQLGGRLARVAGVLSGGEQQMLALARALLARPRVLLLDELSSGLAPAVVGPLLDAVREKATGAAVVLVEQHVHAALSVADYVYVLDRGRIIDVGEAADLRPAILRRWYLGG